jgi:hypothetical protein
MNWNTTIAAVVVIGLATIGFVVYGASVTAHMQEPVHQTPNQPVKNSG